MKRIIAVSIIVLLIASAIWLHREHQEDVREIKARRLEMIALVDSARKISGFYINGGLSSDPQADESLDFPKQFSEVWEDSDRSNREIIKLRAEFDVHIEAAAIAAHRSKDATTRKWSEEMQRRVQSAFPPPQPGP